MEKHNFHIPVMGIGYTADSPLKVAIYGIDSVISLVDDILLEKLRKYHSEQNNKVYREITQNTIDYRALRITSYLNLVHDLIQEQTVRLKQLSSLKSNLLKDYIKHLPNSSVLKEKLTNSNCIGEVRNLLQKYFVQGSIDVNIMTKVDKTNYENKVELPSEYNDAHAALRGFANSKISSSIVFSAGMNPRLYNYLATFNDFYPDAKGYIKKKIILKVSDYRSALIQGKYLAKKGLWVSEYRIESGLNCGGHAFATDGFLMGPVLEEFKQNRETLYKSTYDLFSKALVTQNKQESLCRPELKITAQGGVGTSEEHAFLTEEYKLDSIGWGSPFLLVPEATTVDNNTLNQLEKATEDDIYLSDISPLGVRFNSLRGNTKDVKKLENIQKNRPGSACPKKHVALNQEFKKEGLCISSREYQYLKIKELEANGSLNKIEKEQQIAKVIEKSCICVGLGTSALLKYNIDTKKEGKGVSVCPGPNLAYFNRKISLSDMMSHIYGKMNVISAKRPHLFEKELSLYLDYLDELISNAKNAVSTQQEKYLHKFTNNLSKGIEYYQHLFKDRFEILFSNENIERLKTQKEELKKLQLQIT
ncbi:hypothetical protein [Wenyingzhuangia sp. IMCC45574]